MNLLTEAWASTERWPDSTCLLQRHTTPFYDSVMPKIMALKSDYTSRSKYQFIENKGGGHVKPHHWYAISSVLTVENCTRQTIPFFQQIKCKELKKNSIAISLQLLSPCPLQPDSLESCLSSWSLHCPFPFSYEPVPMCFPPLFIYSPSHQDHLWFPRCLTYQLALSSSYPAMLWTVDDSLSQI